MTSDKSAKSEGSVESREFTHAGLECKLVKQRQGHWCGYVKRPKSVEPVRWRSDYDNKYDEFLDAEVDVWGGITYGPDDGGWVGFDDAHSRSLREEKWPGTEEDWQAVKVETMKLAEQIAELGDGQ